MILSACAVTTASFPHETPAKGQPVTARLSHFSVLYLNSFKDTDRLIADLSAQCAGGRVEGITVTQVNRFWSFVGLNYGLKASGTCVK